MKTWPFNVQNIQQIPGLTIPEQHSQYQELVRSLPSNPKFLEIGCGWGRSTWAWLDVLPCDTQYYILDNFSLPSSHLLKSVPNIYPSKEIKRIIKGNIQQREIFDNIIKQHKKHTLIKNLWHMSGADWRTHNDYTDDWDLVYLDDDHEYATISVWLESFKNVPMVCGDDYSVFFPDVVSAVDEYVKKYNRKFISLPGSFWVIENS